MLALESTNLVARVGVALGVLEQADKGLDAALGPATLVGTNVLALGLAADTTGEVTDGDDLLVCEDVAEVGQRTGDGHPANSSDGLAHVLEVNTEVIDTGLAGCR